MTINLLLVLIAQFLSALSDSALLIVCIARLSELQGPLWLVPMLKFNALLCFLLLAPVAGAVADRWPKERLMVLANLLKVGAGGALLAGLSPIGVILVTGLGAALYAPAKYGLLTEIVPGHRLVWANGYLEVATVSGIVLGTAMGGGILALSPMSMGWFDPFSAQYLADSSLTPAMVVLIMTNGLALALCLCIAPSGAVYERQSLKLRALVKSFYRDNAILLRDPVGRLSLLATASLLSCGSVFQLLVLEWARQSFDLSLGEAAYMQAFSALGLIGGAVLVSRWVRMHSVLHLMPLGCVLGLLILCLPWAPSVPVAMAALFGIGVLSAILVVPMNALLQHRGFALLSAGRSVAVQGFNENVAIISAVLLYAGLVSLDWSTAQLTVAFGVLMVLAFFVLWAVTRNKALRASFGVVAENLHRLENVKKASSH